MPFADELDIPNETLKLGRELNLKFVSKPQNVDGAIDFFVFSSQMDSEVAITLEDVKLFEKMNWTNFNEFCSHAFDVWKISFPKDSNEWRKGTCSCPAFDASFICKHIISIVFTV